MSISNANNNIRIRTTPLGSDKYVKINIDQNFDFLEILSLKIDQEQVYRKYCSDYGVIVGRVVCNKGVGVPNAKISVFIPISEEDKENDKIREIYPFENTEDTGIDGIKYNLLTERGRVDDICHTAIGTFPEKRRILDCEPWCEVYGKYYKFTTSTNASGDYLIFGVPIGVQTVHLDVDLSDIGYLSQKPYDMIKQGSPVELFESYNKFAESPNLGQLPQVKTQNKTINVLPFWGNLDECQVGVNRADFDLNYNIETSAFFIGSIFGDSQKNSVNKNCRPRKKLGRMSDLITGPGTIEMIRKTPFGGIESFVVNGNQNIDDDGTWVVQLPMNLDHKITDEFGNLVDSGNPLVGIATRAMYRFRIGMNDYLRGFARVRSRARFLVPNYGDYTFDDTTPDFNPTNNRPNFATMLWNGVYTVKQFMARYSNRDESKCKDTNFIGIKDVFENLNNNPFPYNRADRNTNPLYNFLCIIFSLLIFVVDVVNNIISVLNDIAGFLGIGKIPCIVVECEGIRFAPGCTEYPNSQTIDDNSRENTRNCLEISLAEALNVFSFYFTNDWINGTLFAFLFKIKLKKNNKSKFCDADVDQNRQFIKDQNCGSIVGSPPNPSCDLVFETKKGVVVEREYELYYASMIDGKYLFATDIYDLGSMKNCDYFGRPKIITEIPPTTFNGLELVDDDSQFAPREERGIDDLLIQITCGGLRQNSARCKNTSRICEIGVNPEIGDSEPITNDSLEEESRDVRADLECLNSGQCSLNVLNGDGGFLQDWKNYRKIYYNNLGYQNPTFNFDENSRPNILNINGINNSFFFYFGLLPGKTAIDKLVGKYFAPCERKEPCPIVINGTVENNKCIGGATGSIVVSPEGGTPPYKYNWFKGTYGPTMTPICVDFSFSPSPITITPNQTQSCTNTISGLESDFYTVIVKDNVGQICKKSFSIEDPQPFKVSVVYSPFICPNQNNGFIEVFPSGGIPPYAINWSGGRSITEFNTGNTNDSFFITGLGSTSDCQSTATGGGTQVVYDLIYETNGNTTVTADATTGTLIDEATILFPIAVQANSNMSINEFSAPSNGNFIFDYNFRFTENRPSCATGGRIVKFVRIRGNITTDFVITPTSINGNSIIYNGSVTIPMNSGDKVRVIMEVSVGVGNCNLFAIDAYAILTLNSGRISLIDDTGGSSGGGSNTSQYYQAIVTDSSGLYGCINVSGLTIDIVKSCGFSLSASSIGSCSANTADGSVTFGVVNGGVPPFTYIIKNTSLNYYWSGNSFDYSVIRNGLRGNNPEIIYDLTVIDSCGYSATTTIGVGLKSLTLINNSYLQLKTPSSWPNPYEEDYHYYIWSYKGNVGSYTFNTTCPNPPYYSVIQQLVNVNNPATYWYELLPLDSTITSRVLFLKYNITEVRITRYPDPNDNTKDIIYIDTAVPEPLNPGGILRMENVGPGGYGQFNPWQFKIDKNEVYFAYATFVKPGDASSNPCTFRISTSQCRASITRGFGS